jgi:hypothetical protein
MKNRRVGEREESQMVVFCWGGQRAVFASPRVVGQLLLRAQVIESAERIEKILPRLDEMVDGGLITLEKVRVILYRPAKK